MTLRSRMHIGRHTNMLHFNTPPWTAGRYCTNTAAAGASPAWHRGAPALQTLRDSKRYAGQFNEYSIVEYFNGWLPDATSLAGRIGANTGQYGIHGLQAFYM